MQIVAFILIALLAAALGAAAVVIFRRSTWGSGGSTGRETSLERERDEALAASAILERDLAVERERSSKVSGLADQLAQTQSARAALETDVAVARQARDGAEEALKASLMRVTELDNQLNGAIEEHTRVKVAYTEAAAQLAERDKALAAESRRFEEASRELSLVRERLANAGNQLAALQETLEQERKQSSEKLELLLKTKDQLAAEFRVFANDLAAQQGEAVTKQNKDQLEGLLSPLREKLTEFQTGLQNAHTETAKDRAALGEQIKQLTSVSATMTNETTNLTRALKGKSQTRGAWGEVVLATVLERSGLREGEEYHVQVSHSNDDGRRLRPDVIVNLPYACHVIIDSKVSLVAYEAYVNAEADEERELHLRKHVESVRAHIKALSSKEYQTLAGGELDYVVLFVPIESAWSVACQADPELALLATESNVAINTPTTLMTSLRTVHSLWRVERRNRNADAIADRAGKLYNKFVAFVEELKQVGTRLTQAQASYDGAMSKLSTGPGNVIRQVEELKAMGAKTTKALPAALIGEVDVKGLPGPDAEEDKAA